jgi:hypothetical protein
VLSTKRSGVASQTSVLKAQSSVLDFKSIIFDDRIREQLVAHFPNPRLGALARRRIHFELQKFTHAYVPDFVVTERME